MPPHNAESAVLESEYEALRRPLLAALRRDFPSLRNLEEELYQEAWTEALEKVGVDDQSGNLEPLVRTVMRRRAIDHLRKADAEPVDPEDINALLLSDPGPTPEELAEIRVDGARVRHVVEHINGRQAAVLKLRFDQGLSYHEIEQVMKISQRRVEKLINRGCATSSTR